MSPLSGHIPPRENYQLEPQISEILTKSYPRKKPLGWGMSRLFVVFLFAWYDLIRHFSTCSEIEFQIPLLLDTLEAMELRKSWSFRARKL